MLYEVITHPLLDLLRAAAHVPGEVARAGRVEESRERYREALAIHREVGNRRFEAYALCDRSLLERQAAGDLDVITSYSIHYTKLYDRPGALRLDAEPPEALTVLVQHELGFAADTLEHVRHRSPGRSYNFV